MRCRVILVLFAAVLTASAENRQIDAKRSNKSGSFISIDEYNYYVDEDVTATQIEAKAMCSAIDNMQLISFQTFEKQVAIMGYMITNYGPYTTYWTSGERTPENWIWSTIGEVMQREESTWGRDQPDIDAPGACIALDSHYVQFFDEACDESKVYTVFCEEIVPTTGRPD